MHSLRQEKQMVRRENAEALWGLPPSSTHTAASWTLATLCIHPPNSENQSHCKRPPQRSSEATRWPRSRMRKEITSTPPSRSKEIALPLELGATISHALPHMGKGPSLTRPQMASSLRDVTATSASGWSEEKLDLNNFLSKNNLSPHTVGTHPGQQERPSSTHTASSLNSLRMGQDWARGLESLGRAGLALPKNCLA